MTSVILFPSVDDAIEKIRDNPEKYGNLEYPGEMKILYNNFAASLLFFSYIKLFKYLNFNKTMGQLNNTLKRVFIESSSPYQNLIPSFSALWISSASLSCSSLYFSRSPNWVTYFLEARYKKDKDFRKLIVVNVKRSKTSAASEWRCSPCSAQFLEILITKRSKKRTEFWHRFTSCRTFSLFSSSCW
jgi:hypothetical protein